MVHNSGVSDITFLGFNTAALPDSSAACHKVCLVHPGARTSKSLAGL
jgi:hypothetical protein